MNKIPASLRSDSSDCRFASESVPISSEYAVNLQTQIAVASPISSAALLVAAPIIC